FSRRGRLRGRFGGSRFGWRRGRLGGGSGRRFGGLFFLRAGGERQRKGCGGSRQRQAFHRKHLRPLYVSVVPGRSPATSAAAPAAPVADNPSLFRKKAIPNHRCRTKILRLCRRFGQNLRKRQRLARHGGYLSDRPVVCSMKSAMA